MVIHSDYPYPVRQVQLEEDLKIAYVQVGKGTETLLFVHGFAGFLPIWERNLERLQKYYQCIALDLPGHGLSSSGDYPFTIAFYAEVIERFIRKLGLKKVILIGHSMGGQISIRFSLAYPELVSRLVLVAPAGFETFTETEKFFISSTISSGIFNAAQYFKNFFNLKNFFFDLSEREYAKLQDFSRDFYSLKDNPHLLKVLTRSSKAMLEEPVFEELADLNMPVLVCFGKKDQLIPNPLIHPETTEAVARRGAEQIRDCQLKLYPRGGHFLQYEQAPRFNIEVYKFLNPSVFEGQ